MPWLDKFWDRSSIINAIFPAKSSPIAAFAMSLTNRRHQELMNKGTTTVYADISRKMDLLSQQSESITDSPSCTHELFPGPYPEAH
jgi:hypothetical protein